MQMLFLMAFAVAGLIAPWNYAPAHDAVPANSTEILDCDYAVTVVSRSDYQICDDMDGYFADEGNKSAFKARMINCDPSWEMVLQGESLDRLWGSRSKCRPWAAKRRTRLEKDVGAQCKEEVRRAKAPNGCEAQGKKVRILYHQHRKEIECKTEMFMAMVADTLWEKVHADVSCQ